MANLPEASDWARVARDAVADLQTLLRMKTVNPPGDEGEAIDFLAARLEAAGIEVTRIDAQGRPNLVARLRGDGTGGGPLLLTGHVDVVPAEPEHWVCDPFGGEIRDGYLYGRGAVDMKNMVTMCLHMMLLLKETGAKLTRDVIFAAVADEEEGCTWGSRYLVEQHPELVRAEHMIGEIGGFSLDVNGVRYYPIQIAEKGICQFRLTAHGEPGHGSMPRDANAVVRLGEALSRLGKARLSVTPVAAVRQQLETLAASQRAPASLVLPLLLRPAAAGFVLDRVLPDRSLAATMSALLSNTVSPTGLEAGFKVNTIPATATAVLDGRVLPGSSSAELLAQVRAVIGEGFTTEIIREFPGREETTDDPLFRAICDNVRRHDPAGVPLPYMIPGFTDAQYFGRLGMRCYGYSPLRFPAEDQVKFSDLFHGHNERIHVEGFQWGLACLWDLVRRWVTAPS